jgi:hypothetical protein
MADAVERTKEKRETQELQELQDSHDIILTKEAKPIQHITQDQRILLETLYENAKRVSASLLANPALDNSLKITQLIAQLMALMEQIHEKKISGADKKAIVLELGKLLIRDHIKDDIQRVKMLLLYDAIAEKTLEVMIDVSHVVNKHAAKAFASCSCWDWIAPMVDLADTYAKQSR